MFEGQFENNASPCSKELEDSILKGLERLKGELEKEEGLLRDITLAADIFQKSYIQAETTREHLRVCNGEWSQPDTISNLQESLKGVEGQLQENRHRVAVVLHKLAHSVSANLSSWASLETRVSSAIQTWKFERRRHLATSGSRVAPTLSSIPSQLQSWCEMLYELIMTINGQLGRTQELLPADGPLGIDATFISPLINQAGRCIGKLLNDCLIVESQPQVIRTKTHLSKPILASFIIVSGMEVPPGDRGPFVSTQIITEEQAKALPIPNGGSAPLVIVTKGEGYMTQKGNNRFHVELRGMMASLPERRSTRPRDSSELVHERKLCIYVSCTLRVAQFQLQLYTISDPIVVITHGSQAALAQATIAWDYAFGERDRTPFHTPREGSWEDVTQILQSTCADITECNLTAGNLACLAGKVFRNHKIPPNSRIAFHLLCKATLPERSCSFWTWFYSALKLVSAPGPHQRRSQVHEFFKEGLIVGFIDKEEAERILQPCLPGTFLLRFSDSILGALSIALLDKSGSVIHVDPRSLDLDNLATQIKPVDRYQFLMKRECGEPVHKDSDSVFGKFSVPLKTGYVPFQGALNNCEHVTQDDDGDDGDDDDSLMELQPEPVSRFWAGGEWTMTGENLKLL